MQVKILFDKDALNKDLHTGWGISFLIDGKLIFDTGNDGTGLIDNMKMLNIDFGKLETVVISHDHWDHIGGLCDILREIPGLRIYICPNFSRDFKNKAASYGARLIEVDKFTEIGKDIYTTGEIKSVYAFRYIYEQALVAKTSGGLTVFTGCAHPGIIETIETVRGNMPGEVNLVMGGFHLIDKKNEFVKSVISKFRQLGVRKTAPGHCTGTDAVKLFKKDFGNDFVETKVGMTIEV